MAIYQRRRSRRFTRIRPGVLVLATVLLAVGVWWVLPRSDSEVPTEQLSLGPRPTLISHRPEVRPDSQPPADVSEKGEPPAPARAADASGSGARQVESRLAAGRQALGRGDFLAARAYLSEAMQLGIDEPELSAVRAELTRIGNETIFSPRIFENDPLASRYVIQPGDAMARIAQANKVSADLLAAVNGIADANRIRAGQTIKVINGPFHAVVHKRSYTMDVYLGHTFVKHFKVGLGADDSTPEGEWRVGTKLVNPTYYPPRGGQVVAADDPKNPLAERWIGLVGVSGEAAGQHRYGVHGTVEPDSIGRSVSLGCIRMYNEDVEALYTYLIEQHSTVTVVD